MATPTLTVDGATISTAESTTNWNAYGGLMSPVLSTDFFRQGTAAVSGDAKGSTGRRTIAFDSVTPIDFTVAGRHLFIWIWIANENIINTLANGGARLYVSSSAGGTDTNYEEFTIGHDLAPWVGKGWRLFELDINGRTGEFTNGTLNKASCRQFGLTIDLVATLGKADGFAVDLIRYGSKMEATGGSSTDPVTVQNIVDQDAAGGGDTQYGILYEGPNQEKLLNGILVAGDEAGSTNSVFDFKNQTIFAQDNPCADDATGIRISADTGTTEITIGTKIGSGVDAVGANGLAIRNIQGELNPMKKVFLEGEGATVNITKLYDTRYNLRGPVSIGTETALGGSGDTVELIDNTFLNCDRIKKNIGGTVLTLLRNTIAFNRDFKAALDIEDQADIDGSEFNLLQSSGLIETSANATSVTFNASNFDFTKALPPYINVTDLDEIWNVINPSWNLETGKMKAVEFVNDATVTDNAGHANLPVVQTNPGAKRHLTRASNGDLYYALVNSGGTAIEIHKSTDDGVTWGTALDSANAPGGTEFRGPSIAIDSSGVIQIIWYEGGAVDAIKHTSFATSTDQWNAGGAAVETNIRTGITTITERMAIAVDSLDTVHVIYADDVTWDIYYNNDISFSTNEVQIFTANTGTNFDTCDIAIRPSDDIPLCFVAAKTSTTASEATFYEGNARDATSFTSKTIASRADQGILQGVMCVCDNDDAVVAWCDTVEDEFFIARVPGGLATSDVEIVFRTPTTTTGAAENSIAARNNRVVWIYADKTDNELYYHESRNYGLGWSDRIAVTSATTTTEPLLRAVHGLHEGEPWRIDVSSKDGSDNALHQEIAYLTTIAGDVNEKYQVTVQAKEPDGTLINTAREKLIEANPTPALANEASTGAAGQAVVIDFLRRLIEPGTSDNLSVTDHNPTILKSYKYLFLPFVTNLGTLNAKVSVDAIHLDDVYNVQTNPATAITLGDTTNNVQVENQGANPASIIKFTGGSGTLTVGAVVNGASSGADGTVVEIIEGDSTAGTVLLDTRDGVNYTASETLNEVGGGGDWSATFTGGSQVDFTWLIDASTLTPQELYDYFNAKFNEATLDVTAGKDMDDVAIWGRAEHGLPIQGAVLGSPNKFQTVRNVALTEGWAVYNLGGVGLSGFTQYVGDDGTAFTPAATVTLTITVLEAEDFVTPVVGARVGIHRQSDNSEIVNDVTNASGIVSASFTYTADVAVFIRVRQETENYVKIPATITASGLTQDVAVGDDDIYTMT